MKKLLLSLLAFVGAAQLHAQITTVGKSSQQLQQEENAAKQAADSAFLKLKNAVNEEKGKILNLRKANSQIILRDQQRLMELKDEAKRLFEEKHRQAIIWLQDLQKKGQAAGDTTKLLTINQIKALPAIKVLQKPVNQQVAQEVATYLNKVILPEDQLAQLENAISIFIKQRIFHTIISPKLLNIEQQESPLLAQQKPGSTVVQRTAIQSEASTLFGEFKNTFEKLAAGLPGSDEGGNAAHFALLVLKGLKAKFELHLLTSPELLTVATKDLGIMSLRKPLIGLRKKPNEVVGRPAKPISTQPIVPPSDLTPPMRKGGTPTNPR